MFPISSPAPSFPRLIARRSAFTLTELLIATTITSLISVVLGGLMLAVESAWRQTSGLETAQAQSRASLDRLNYMVSQAGTYRISGQPVRAGVAVVEQVLGGAQVSPILVIWSGGRLGGMAAQGVQARLPLVNELVIYAPQQNRPQRLIELVVPGDSSTIDFTAANFSTRIIGFLTTSGAQSVVLADRVRVSTVAGVSIANVRFETFETPSAAQLSGITPGTTAWNNLSWSQGIVSGEMGLRTLIVRYELQIESRINPAPGSSSAATVLPYFGSASYAYVYRP